MHVHADYPPPRSWDQFEELCADIFQAEWRDPALVRHGRAGQRQHGVDIVGRNGSMYPVGLQCKKKSAWPVSKLTCGQIDTEIKAAREFKPTLKASYLLTTAPDDEALQRHVRSLNEDQAKAKSFEVILLGWGELVRRATCHTEVADKHFGARGAQTRSPLLGTFYLSRGELEAPGEDELKLTIRELIQDFRDDPAGHIVVRQRESDALVEQIAALGAPPRTKEDRTTRIRLRDELQKLKRQEARAIEGVRLMLTDLEMTSWLLAVWDPDIAVRAVISFLNTEVVRSLTKPPMHAMYLRMSPPRAPRERASALLSLENQQAIQDIMKWRVEQYGNTCTNTVMELPERVLAEIAVPRIVRGILETHEEEHIPMATLRDEGRFDLGSWKVSIA